MDFTIPPANPLPWSLTASEGKKQLRASNREDFRKKYIGYQKVQGKWVAVFSLKGKKVSQVPETSLDDLYADIRASPLWESQYKNQTSTVPMSPDGGRPLFDHRLVLPKKDKKNPFSSRSAPLDTSALNEQEMNALSEQVVQISLDPELQTRLIEGGSMLKRIEGPGLDLFDLKLANCVSPSPLEDYIESARGLGSVFVLDPRFKVTAEMQKEIIERVSDASARRLAKSMEEHKNSPLPPATVVSKEKPLPPRPPVKTESQPVAPPPVQAVPVVAQPGEKHANPLKIMRPRLESPIFTYMHNVRLGKANKPKQRDDIPMERIKTYLAAFFQPSYERPEVRNAVSLNSKCVASYEDRMSKRETHTIYVGMYTDDDTFLIQKAKLVVFTDQLEQLNATSCVSSPQYDLITLKNTPFLANLVRESGFVPAPYSAEADKEFLRTIHTWKDEFKDEINWLFNELFPYTTVSRT